MSADGVGPDAVTMRLVGAVQAGDMVAREQLFERYLPKVARMVSVRLRVPRHALSPEDEDLCQDALLQALNGIDGFEMRSPGAFMAWMETIVLNGVRKRHRRRMGAGERALWQRYGDVDLRDSFFAGDGPSPSGIAMSGEQNAAVEAELLNLPGIYARALVGRHVGGMSYAELAEHLGRSEVSCRKLVQRALAMLRERLERRA